MSLFTPTPALPNRHSPPPATPTTDGTLLESQKENIRPLASGRSAATLQALFKDGSGTSAAEKILAEGHERFKRVIEEAEKRDKEGEEMVEGMTDLLDAYCQ
jgi:checkpoint serine/threonine-protein kinase